MGHYKIYCLSTAVLSRMPQLPSAVDAAQKGLKTYSELMIYHLQLKNVGVIVVVVMGLIVLC